LTRDLLYALWKLKLHKLPQMFPGWKPPKLTIVAIIGKIELGTYE
jgi:hypothetical protein